MQQQMQQPLVRLVYKSQAVAEYSGPMLGTLNIIARHHNARGRVSGLLLFHHGWFFGVLEGSRNCVEECASRIGRDPRHRGITVLSNGGIHQRAFDWWKMGIAVPSEVPASMGRGVFALHELAPPDSPMRGADPEVRCQVRKFLASFATLSDTPLKVAS